MPRPADSLPDNLIEKLVRDPADVPDLRALAGYLGRSSRPRHIRLYLTPDLGDYVEIPEDGVVHKESLTTEDRPLGGTAVWIRREAKTVRVRSASREAQADFLRGALSNHLRQTHPGAGRFKRLTPAPYAGLNFHLSSVPEFCDFVILSFLGGGSVYCTEDYACGVSNAAECP